MKYNVPFYSNTPDGTHCYQAALRSVLKYFLPDKEFTWIELEKMTSKKEGLWTWPASGLLSLHEMGFEIIKMDTFDIKEFINDGGQYLLKINGPEASKRQIENSDIEHEKENYKKFLKLKLHKKALPDIEYIKKFIDSGYLVICNINSRILNKKSGYSGHFVIIIGYDDENLLLHDPGLPPQKDRKVKFKLFSKALAYPDEQSKNLIALKYISGKKYINA